MKLTKNKSIYGQILRKKVALVCVCEDNARKESSSLSELEHLAEPNIQIPAMTGLLPSLSKGRVEGHILQPKGLSARSIMLITERGRKPHSMSIYV